jgi:NTP pyrophosphatase (non-canonical NTP hydrolase)
METKIYENEIARTRGGNDDLFWALGLGGETGEVLDLVKKLHFHGGVDRKGPITPQRLLNECGDVLWYLTTFLNFYSFTLEDCMKENVRKLQARHPNGFTNETAWAHADEKKA